MERCEAAPLARGLGDPPAVSFDELASSYER